MMLLGATLLATSMAWADWDPARFSELDTLDFLTVGPDDDEHWSRVWLVVLDGDVYVRLGSRAADRIEGNTRAPLVDVRIGEETFTGVRVEPMPDMTERVAEAMAEKYSTDVLVRYLAHPLTARLVPSEN